jgi:hypothetical protein
MAGGGFDIRSCVNDADAHCTMNAATKRQTQRETWRFGGSMPSRKRAMDSQLAQLGQQIQCDATLLALHEPTAARFKRVCNTISFNYAAENLFKRARF